MSTVGLFALQFFWFLVAWSTIAVMLVAPRLRDRDAHDVLAVWVAPHLFRVLGVGLLVPSLSPGMPAGFAVPTAIGDTLTAVLALFSLIALRARWRHARAFVWGFNLFGSLDLVIALVQAVRVSAAAHLEAQWYVAVLAVPLMIVSHVMVFRTLLRHR
jgi:hypothetical protein